MIPLHQIVIAKPCPANWNAMRGDTQTRFCANCKQAVHDLSQMTAAQAQSLLDRTNGNVCVRITRTGDGRILTRDTAFTSKKGRKARGPVPKAKPRIKPPVTVLGGAPICPPPPPTHTLGKIVPPEAQSQTPAPPPQQTVTAHEVHAEAMQSAKMGQPYAVSPK